MKFNRDHSKNIVISIYFLILGWTLIIIGLAYWSYKNTYSGVTLLAQREAYKGFEKDVMFRAWTLMHGGVYVPVSLITQPNPYLSHVPERDITTPFGKKLTLMNPAYVTRQVHEISFAKNEIRGHITSLNPIRSENEADKWEINALRLFDKGVKEYFGIDTILGKKFFRYMAPLITEKSCLKCHESQGYKLGDIRGGISSSIPWDNYQASINKQTFQGIFSYGTVWLIGFVSLMFVKRRFVIYIIKRDEYENQMARLNEELIYSKTLIEEALIEKNRLVEELFELNTKLEKTNSEKDKFFSIIAHDLRSPFHGLMGITSMIMDDPESFTKEELVELNKQAHSSSSKLYKLLQNLLEWAQMKNGMLVYNPHKINLYELLLQNFLLKEEKSKQKEIKISLQVPQNIEVFADENMLNSIVRNLLSNAFKFTPQSGNITISCKMMDNNFIEVSVTDSGIGIPENIMQKLFKQDQKVGRAGLNGEESTGLGLLLCKEFVERHGGTISAVSNALSGTTFSFSIPLIQK